MMFLEQRVHCVTSIFKCRVEDVYNKSLSKLKIHSLLEHREDLWILKLKTLSLQGLNM